MDDFGYIQLPDDSLNPGKKYLTAIAREEGTGTEGSAGEQFHKQVVTIIDFVSVDDGGGNLSIDDGGNLISIDDGGGSITVDGTVAVSNAFALESTLSTLNGKVTACNTGAVVVSSGSITVSNSFALESTLSTLNGKVTACNTGAVVISSGSVTVSNAFALESTLSTLNGKVTACNTGAVVISSSALPTGASTAAKQPALGTAGTASADVITIQGISGMTAVKVDGSAVAQPVTDNGGNLSIDDGGNSITVDGTVTTTQGTAAALSGAWPIKLTDGTNTMPTMDVAARAGFNKITDGTNTAAVKAASTAAAAADPALVVSLSPNSPIVEPKNSPRVIGVSGTLGITTSATWDERARWAVPAGKVYKPKTVRCGVTTAGTRTLILAGSKMATWNPGTNTFASVASLTSPDFYDRLFYRIASSHSATATTVTATYTDQDGNASQSTGGLVIPASAAAGDWYEFILATDDFGVQAVTGASDTANPTSVVDEIWGFRTLFDSLGPATTLEQVALGDGFGVDSTESIVILFNAAATSTQIRLAQVLGELVAA